MHRSRVLTPAQGGHGIILAGLNNTIAHGSEIVGFSGTASDGLESRALLISSSSITNIDVTIGRCNIAIGWLGNNTPLMLGRIFFTDNVSIPEVGYSANTSILQRGLLEVRSPFGSSKQSVLSVAGSVNVTTSSQQSVNVPVNLLYVPSLSEVKTKLVTNQPSAQAVYAEDAYINYISGESSRANLVFKVKVDVIANAASGGGLLVKLN